MFFGRNFFRGISAFLLLVLPEDFQAFSFYKKKKYIMRHLVSEKYFPS